MNVMFRSTRNAGNVVTASQAVLKGLAEDGGLYVPEYIPGLDVSLEALADMTYHETAYAVMKQFLSDYTEEELKYCIRCAYDEKFDTPEIVPVHEADGAYYLELFHGATIAFKDMALSILPYLMTTAAKKNQEDREIVILTATSGDTGKAALSGFADVPGTRILVFYPKDGVSAVQEKQMVTQKGDNTCVIGIRGNFDDAQTGVKNLFGDKALGEELHRAGFRFSSANSINIGRLVPQIVYYVYAYGRLLKRRVLKAGEPMNVVVPTGNFGNILAAFYAKNMGLPVGRLICASNENKVLYDFFESGTYDRNREFVLTTSPSMDILVSSNLERLIYRAAGDDAEKNAQLMQELASTGAYTVTPQMRERMKDFCGGFATREQTAQEIGRVYQETGYVLDPHTAVASSVYHAYREAQNDTTPAVIAATASPYKFARSVMEAIDGAYGQMDDFALIDELSKLSGTAVPRAIEEIRNAPVLHDRVIEKEEMEQAVKEFLGIA
ncbi:threonine synthase [Parablautia sp. Marseille-Q6255]|uniref:threonine synthase n=1 Tax=Parablautia sp. Marseille-Q6255 TaxID=3039593 RepID=UPI0024BC658E|nr:threonine synthase [Parablautia sp. Marseille-Q6255]